MPFLKRKCGDQIRQQVDNTLPVEASGQLAGFKHEAMTEEQDETQNMIDSLVI